MKMREIIDLVDGKAPLKPPAQVTPEIIRRIRAMREQIRAEEGGGGYCHEVSEWIARVYGWERMSGTYCARNRDVICPTHFWNVLPDGSILDSTADQFGEGNDIRVIRPDDPEFARYRIEWNDDYHPDHPDYDADHPRDGWTGEFDDDAYDRLAAERGHDWWVTDKEGHGRYVDQQVKYGEGQPWGYRRPVKEAALDFDPEKSRALFDLDLAAARGNLDKKAVKDFRRLLSGAETVRLYHGTVVDHDVWEQGLLRTVPKRQRSLQSGNGFVYLSYDPRRALGFAQHGYPYDDTFVVYAVEVPVKLLKADTDQLFNKRMWGSDATIGSTVIDSLIHGGGVRVKGDIPTWRIKVHGYFDRAGNRIPKPEAHNWGDDRYR